MRIHRTQVVISLLFFTIVGFGQQNSQALYRPAEIRESATLNNPDTTDAQSADTDSARWLESRDLQDSLNRDSIAARLAFVRDSIMAREIFVRDSLARRKRVLDSLNLLREALPVILEAIIKTSKDDIFIARDPINIINDSLLSDCIFTFLPIGLDAAYTPWKKTINLSNDPIGVRADTVTRRIISINSRDYSGPVAYDRSGRIIILEGKSSILNKPGGRLYKIPVDSVFFNSANAIIKIKRYNRFYSTNANYQRGNLLFVALTQVKQYSYKNGSPATYEITNFCDRETVSAPRKVCNIVHYSLEKQGNSFTVNKEQNPSNKYADGTYHYEFDASLTLTSVAFSNPGNTENWKTFVEVNDKGNVSRYVYQKNGWVHQTLLINYFEEPGAKFKVEKISCVFEDDGISYYQKNNTTGKSRRRDRMTGEWSPWQD